MPTSIRRASYFYLMVQDRPGEAYKLLSALASSEVNLLAFNAIPTGSANTQLVLFPAEPERLVQVAQRIGLTVSGPHHAILIRGDDELGALVDIHAALSDAGINVYASHGLADGEGGFGYLVFVRSEEFERAAQVLQAV